MKPMLIVVLVIALILLSPMVFLWAVNSLAEAGGAKFYIEHNLWNYFVTLVFIAVLRGGSK